MQRPLGRNNNLTVDLPEQLNLFSRLPFDVAAKFQQCLHFNNAFIRSTSLTRSCV
jgi:hypothetical protein